MPRPARLDLPGVPVHVIQRGVNRTACFFTDTDRRFYLKCVMKAAERRGCAVHAYVLMTNHVHLLVTPADKGALGAMLQDVGRTYVRVINTIHGRTGTLWQGRYKSSAIDSTTYLLACHRYIELNPVRAGMVVDPAAYEWSSHRHYAFGQCDRVIHDHSLYAGLGGSDRERQAAFRSLFACNLEARTVNALREAANTNSAIGSPSFMHDAQAKAGRPVHAPKRGRPPKENKSAQNAGTTSVIGKLL